SRRLESLYTDLIDTNISSTKVSDTEVDSIVGFAKAHLEIAKTEGEVNEELRITDDMDWFINATDILSKRAFIFGNQSQEKLIELGDVAEWISWLKKHFDKEAETLKELLLKEIR